jgi:lysophospholipid acyltransferase (LPLAT)-like uncharacterized protein
MSEKHEEIYRQTDLSRYSFKKKLTIHLADLIFFALIKIIGKTLKYETEGFEHLDKISAEGKSPIYVFWHNRIFPATFFFKDQKIVVMTSQSLDGEYIARFIKRFGYGASRGSSTRGGIGPLVEMIRLSKRKIPTAFTIDGPKGPRYVAKSGAGLLAKKTGNPIIPVGIESAKFREINSWDKLQIPRFFSRVKIVIGEPIYVAEDADAEAIEKSREELQKKLDELTELGQQWREAL